MTVTSLQWAGSEVRGEFLPHAIFKVPVREAVRRVGGHIASGVDSFDAFDEAAFLSVTTSADELPFVIIHYRGHPPGTSTVYLPPAVTNVETITRLVSAIVQDLGLSKDVLAWQRADDPEL